MPLAKGSSEAVIGRNIKEMERAGHPHKVAVAASLHNADKFSATSDSSDRTTCSIFNWPVFTSGVHKETAEFFSPRDNAQIGSNFRRFSHINVAGKIGHDRKQRYRDSLGLPAAGRVVAMHVEPDGEMVFDQVNKIPVLIGSAIVSGLLPGVSIELAPRGEPGRRIIRDPADPSADIDGDVLIGFAFLGDELPAVPGYEIPPPVFDDGTPVPPLTAEQQQWWYEKMAPFLTPAGSPADQDTDTDEYSGWSVAFSAMTFDPVRTPVDPKIEQLVALGLTPEQAQQALAICVEEAAEAEDVMAAEPAAAPMGAAPPAEFTAMAAEMAEMKKHYGAMAEKFTAMEKEKEAACMSAFAQRVDAVIKRTDAAKKIDPLDLPGEREAALDILTKRTFASTDDREAAFGRWERRLANLPVNPLFTNTQPDNVIDRKGLAAANPQLAALLNSPVIARSFPDSAPKLGEKFGVTVKVA